MNFYFDNPEYDLHGYDTQQATASILNILYELRNSYYDYIDVIVGIGTRSVYYTVVDILDKERCHYKFLNTNQSKIRIYRK
ncbi:Uncharacterised protein [Metamycoplasma cloacale]|uniref:DNA mismatch repair protein MutS n=1 Tax=Metamycoplasma cloacale TaxID=92401 RepID=A0A2Z4LL91_9BACT|nr:hypothetical protein [Metamycoplasma cloacale]AWX42502.1 DNA mismatch repair protein MutS [Metamycoplasma cloacale]VEU79152.1 Uncharacterised protein [Metamycoplasma cloacale]